MHRLRFTGNISESEFTRQCAQWPWWYHRYEFDNGYKVHGDYDIGADIAEYGFPASLAGKKVLDIGTGAGWFAFYFEQLGAEVTAVDARGRIDLDEYGRYDYPGVGDRKPDRIEANGEAVYFSASSGAFWKMREILGSRVRFRNSRVYDISPALFGGERFDLVFMGAILCHLRDPIGALMAARSVCAGRLAATTPVVIGEAAAETGARQYLPYTDIDSIGWWLPNEACFRQWFLAAGFRDVDIGRQVILRGAGDHPDEKGRITNEQQLLRVGWATI